MKEQTIRELLDQGAHVDIFFFTKTRESAERMIQKFTDNYEEREHEDSNWFAAKDDERGFKLSVHFDEIFKERN